MQVDNATTHLVTLNVQLVGLSGNATVLTSKAPGERGQSGGMARAVGSGMARASGIHATPRTTPALKFHATPIANIAASTPLRSADPSTAPPERQRLGRRSDRVSHRLAAPPGGQHCAIGQQRQAHAGGECCSGGCCLWLCSRMQSCGTFGPANRATILVGNVFTPDQRSWQTINDIEDDWEDPTMQLENT